MSRNLSLLVKEVIGPGHALEDGNPIPVAFREIPIAVGGVPPATPAGVHAPTGSPVSTIPKPQ